MTDSESERESGLQEANAAPATTKNTATQGSRSASAAGCDHQAAHNSVDTDTDDEDYLAAIQGRSGQPSSHGAAEASTSGLPDSSTAWQAAGVQQQQGRRRLRTAGGKVVGTKKAKAAERGSAGNNAVGRGDTAAAGQLNTAVGRGDNATAGQLKIAVGRDDTAAAGQLNNAVGTGDSAAAGQLNNRGRSPFSFDCTLGDSDVGGSEQTMMLQCGLLGKQMHATKVF